MEEFKGTKGEWEVGEQLKSLVWSDKSRTKYIVACDESIGISKKEAEANAKLIAASPNLLHRLNSLILSVKAHPDYVFGEDGDEWHDLISLSEEAINKALK